MPERWIGLVVASDSVVVVDAEVPASGPLVLEADDTWNLQGGDRPRAYHVMYQRIADYVREHRIERVVIKETALNPGGTSKSHLEAAELRGVVIAAAASSARTETLARGLVSRTYGSRKVEDYIEDAPFWASEVAGHRLRKGSREAAMLLLAARKAR
jgi:hypothetical protein